MSANEHLANLLAKCPPSVGHYFESATPTSHLAFLLELDPRALEWIEKNMGKKAKSEVIHVALTVHAQIIALHGVVGLSSEASPLNVAKALGLHALLLGIISYVLYSVVMRLILFFFGTLISTLFYTMSTLASTLHLNIVAPAIMYALPSYIALATITTLPPPFPLLNHYCSIPDRRLGQMTATTRKMIRTNLIIYFVTLAAIRVLQPVLVVLLPGFNYWFPIV
jgi:hypothetical protein